MVQNYLSGFLDLIASIIIFYQSIILYKKKCLSIHCPLCNALMKYIFTIPI